MQMKLRWPHPPPPAPDVRPVPRPWGLGTLLYYIRDILLFLPLILRNPSGGLSTPRPPLGSRGAERTSLPRPSGVSGVAGREFNSPETHIHPHGLKRLEGSRRHGCEPLRMLLKVAGELRLEAGELRPEARPAARCPRCSRPAAWQVFSGTRGGGTKVAEMHKRPPSDGPWRAVRAGCPEIRAPVPWHYIQAGDSPPQQGGHRPSYPQVRCRSSKDGSSEGRQGRKGRRASEPPRQLYTGPTHVPQAGGRSEAAA